MDANQMQPGLGSPAPDSAPAEGVGRGWRPWSGGEGRRQAMVVTALVAAVFATALSLFAAWRSGAASVKPMVAARAFVLTGPDGSVRARWEVTEGNDARLAFYDATGTARLKLTVQPGDGGAGITLADAQGRARVVVGLLPDQTSSLVFADAAGRTRAVLGLSAQDAATVVFADRDGVTRAGLGVDGAGLSSLMLADSVRSGTSTKRQDPPAPPSPPQNPVQPGGVVGRPQ
jgi:hypothetical protein